MVMLEEKCRDLTRALKERKAENMALMIASREATVTPQSNNLEVINET
jgi:hypothetical protein